jgi:uncharacterized membrane protein
VTSALTRPAQENHLLAHWMVHSREYQERTKVLHLFFIFIF